MALPAGVAFLVSVAALPLSDRLVLEVRHADIVTDDCPSDEAILSGIEARLGGGVFVDEPGSGTVLVVDIAADQGAYTGGVSLVGADGRARGSRHVEPQPTCAALVDRLVLAAAIAIDPLGPAGDIGLPPLSNDTAVDQAAAPPELADGPKAGADANLKASAQATVDGADDARGAALRVGAGLGAAFGAWPTAAFYGQLLAGVAVDRFELDVRVKHEPTAPQLLAPGVAADVNRTVVAVSPCLQISSTATLLLCGVVEGALASVTAKLALGAAVAAPQVSAGPRLALELPLTPALGLRMEAEAVAVLLRPRLRDTLTAEVLYDVGPANGALSLGLVFTP